MADDRDDGKWLDAMLRRQAQANGDSACVDAELLAAWADGNVGREEARAIESHAATCMRCLGVLAAMERSQPDQGAAAPPAVRLVRWLVPAMAAAAAVLIWVAVPTREATSPAVVSSQESERRESASAPAPLPESPTVPQREADATAFTRPPPSLLDEARQERSAAGDLSARSGAQPPRALADTVAPEPPSSPAAPAAKSAASADSTVRGDTASANTAMARQAETQLFGSSNESQSPLVPEVRWRSPGGRTIERSLDSGRTWTRVATPTGVTPLAGEPLSIVGITAHDATRARVRTSDGRELYTIDGGASWTVVQENSPAPF